MPVNIILFRRLQHTAYFAFVLLLSLYMFAGASVVGGRALPRKSIQTRQPASSAGRPLELKDFYRIETAGSPAISPDGRFVAYVRTYIVEAENRRQNEIWLATRDGSAAPRRLTEQGASAS